MKQILLSIRAEAESLTAPSDRENFFNELQGGLCSLCRELLPQTLERSYVISDDVLDRYFENCADENEEGFSLDEDELASIRDKMEGSLIALLGDLSDTEDRRDAVRRCAGWLKGTSDALCRAQGRCQGLGSRIDRTNESGLPAIFDTNYAKEALLQDLYTFFIKQISRLFPEPYRGPILFNFWGSELDKDADRLKGQTGLLPEDRAKVFQRANDEKFEDYIVKCCRSFERSTTNAPYDEESDIDGMEEPYKAVPEFLYAQFTDYCRRARHTGGDDAAIVRWPYECMSRIVGIYRKDIEDLHNSWLFRSASEGEKDYFYIECALLTLSKLWSDYFDDAEEIAESRKGDASAPRKYYEPSGLPDGAFDELAKLFVSFKIIVEDSADRLEDMLCRADIAPIYRSPNITRIRFALIRLKSYFGPEWEEAVSANLGKRRGEIFRGYNVDSDFEKNFPDI